MTTKKISKGQHDFSSRNLDENDNKKQKDFFILVFFCLFFCLLVCWTYTGDVFWN